MDRKNKLKNGNSDTGRKDLLSFEQCDGNKLSRG
jgi:hypothetical protein